MGVAGARLGKKIFLEPAAVGCSEEISPSKSALLLPWKPVDRQCNQGVAW